MDFEQTVRHNATYWSEDGEGTAGYLLSEEQFAAILAAHHKALEQAEQAPQGQFTTYTGEAISLCSNCPQFKRENGWDITQCNHCATRLALLTESKSSREK